MPTLCFMPKNTTLRVPKGTRLIDAVRQAGLPIARACGDQLICASCGVEILDGSVSRESATELRTKRNNRTRAGLRLACAIRVYDDLVLTADYWGPVE